AHRARCEIGQPRPCLPDRLDVLETDRLEGRGRIRHPVPGHAAGGAPVVLEPVDQRLPEGHTIRNAVQPDLDDAVMLQDELAVRRTLTAGLRVVLPDVPETVHEQALGKPGPLDLVEALELRWEEIGLV